jgi:hypothetical protein
MWNRYWDCRRPDQEAEDRVPGTNVGVDVIVNANERSDKYHSFDQGAG